MRTEPQPTETREPRKRTDNGQRLLAPVTCSASWGDVSVVNSDCMVVMSKLADNAYDLAIVDPPYGIGEGDGRCRTRLKHNNRVKHAPKSWDDKRPPAEYWQELRRVSKHQIVWGANYFTEYLPPSMGWVFWDKRIGGDFSDGELAYTSFQRALQKVTLWNGNNGQARNPSDTKAGESLRMAAPRICRCRMATPRHAHGQRLVSHRRRASRT